MNQEILLPLIILLLIVFVIYLVWSNKRERQDLYNRLMAKDLADYKNGGLPPKLPVIHNGIRKKMREMNTHPEEERR